ncbi:hypothetical protein KSP39_PZI018641 [Platanthera zijinensis]|uniref:CCHC-type domain-containing protein n=1 Tax=Platanthera zijinensis TaxID=2320716 RepID=A0AAP0B2J9_9ASPA
MEFSKLAYYAGSLVASEEDRCRQFQQGLQDDIRNLLVPLDILEYGKLVERARLIEIDQSKTLKNRESGKRKATEIPTQSEVQSKDVAKTIQIGPSTSTMSQANSTKCTKCNRFHKGECLIGACYYCRQPGHTKRNCLKLLNKEINAQPPLQRQLYQMLAESLASAPAPPPAPAPASAPIPPPEPLITLYKSSLGRYFFSRTVFVDLLLLRVFPSSSSSRCSISTKTSSSPSSTLPPSLCCAPNAGDCCVPVPTLPCLCAADSSRPTALPGQGCCSSLSPAAVPIGVISVFLSKAPLDFCSSAAIFAIGLGFLLLSSCSCVAAVAVKLLLLLAAAPELLFSYCCFRATVLFFFLVDLVTTYLLAYLFYILTV